MNSKRFSQRMLESKKHTGSGTHSYKWRSRKTPWKMFLRALTKPRDTALGLFGNKRFVLGVAAVILIIGGVSLSQGPLFHSQVPVTSQRQDPFTYLWQTDLSACANNGIATEFNFQNAGCVGHGTSFCPNTSGNCLEMSPNTPSNGFPAIVQTKTPVDISTASGKELAFNFLFTIGTSATAQFVIEIYLTENSTLSGATNYEPFIDKSVVADLVYDASGGTGTATISIYQRLRVGETLTQENTGCATNGASSDTSCFGRYVDGVCHTGVSGDYNTVGLLLNYTGSQTAGGGVSTANTHACAGANGFTTISSVFPQLPLTGSGYYLGFWESPTFAQTRVDFQGAGYNGCFMSALFTQINCMSIANAIPSGPIGGVVGPQPTIDTGGFFGPIIRALIQIGVFIVQNIISFLAFLATLLFPVLATVFSVLVNALVAVLNAIGNFFGLGNIGTTIQNFFNSIATFLVNAVGAIVGQISNAVNFFVNAVTAFVNLANTYFGYITGFLTSLASFLGILGTVITTLLTLSAFSGSLALFMDWTWGIYKVYGEGTEGFHRWLDFNEKVFLKAGTLTYFIADHLFQYILRVKQLIVQWV